MKEFFKKLSTYERMLFVGWILNIIIYGILTILTGKFSATIGWSIGFLYYIQFMQLKYKEKE